MKGEMKEIRAGCTKCGGPHPPWSSLINQKEDPKKNDKEELDALLYDSEHFMGTSKNINETNMEIEFEEFMKVKFEEADKKERLVSILKNHKEAFTWKTSDIPGINSDFCKHTINFEDSIKPVIQRQSKLNPNMKEVVKKETIKVLNSGIIYPIEDSP
nr:reverse transcriptase domain-containing protein [Tanacetum cinerariifolium]